MSLKILVDENIPAAVSCFSQFGEVRRVNGRQLSKTDIADAEVLIVRSVTKVCKHLLDGTGVRFVGSTTIGTDHLDLNYLAESGIKTCNAPGSNAESVVDYVISAICQTDDLLERLLSGEPVGIIGFGNVGKRLARRLEALGIAWRAYDPLLNKDEFPHLGGLDDVLRCSLLCLHAPLTRTGDHPSFHMLDTSLLTRLPEDAVLLNAGRGEIVSTDSLMALSRQRPDISLLLDVWEGEPAFPVALANRCRIATPHIAGYSVDGKLSGLRMVASQLAEFLGVQYCDFDVPLEMTAGETLHCSGANRADFIRRTVLSVYDVKEDDERFRRIINELDRGLAFDLLRKQYPLRRELAYSSLVATSASFKETLNALQSGR
ncbi:4-phosphoerythronate dehydrogenase [Zhongshania aliphaticivorans]|uniref:4-phosphoerythronate dehydrogenase n=1 Tax=Zhongshania aliphaticivorans TaxID=1470434 RepID=UPI00133002E1|nr:4-phosphoerythronate dehydrogenase [Zhongshania aliphaticivorans]